MKKILIFWLLVFGYSNSLFAQQFAVKTNALYLATSTLNLGAELAISKHSTFSLTANYNPWVIGHDGKIQHWLVQPEYRYWLTEKYTRLFFGVQATYGRYELGGFRLPLNLLPPFATNYYKGWAAGAGLTIGYQFYISPHWNLEAMVGAGYLRMRYARSDAPKAKTSRNYFGPTAAGISFIYLFNSAK